jgi:hypothetical protein
MNVHMPIIFILMYFWLIVGILVTIFTEWEELRELAEVVVL